MTTLTNGTSYSEIIRKQIKYIVLSGVMVIIICLFLLISSVVLFNEIEKDWDAHNKQAVEVAEAMADLNRHIGYGGFIHNFKNLVLRTDLPRYQPLIDNDIKGFREDLDRLDVLFTNPRDIEALAIIRNTFEEYAAKYALIPDMIYSEATTAELDAVVKVNDHPALDAIGYLKNNIVERANAAEKIAREKQQTAQLFAWFVGMFVSATIIVGIIIISFGVRRINKVDYTRSRLEAKNKETSEKLRKSNHELAAHQIQLEMQNEELRTAHTNVQTASDRYAELYEHAPVGYVLVDSNGVIRKNNATWCEMIDQAHCDLRGRPFAELLVDTDNHAFRSRFKAIFKQPENKHLNVQVKRDNNKPFYAHISVKRSAENYQELMMIISDVSEQRHAQEELREQRNFSERLINTAQAIILVLDTQGRIVSFNPYMEQLSGYALSEVEGKSWFDTFIQPADTSTIEAIFTKTSDDIDTTGTINPIRTKSGETILVEWGNTPLKKEDGTTGGILSIGQDVTERSRLENEIKKLAYHDALTNLPNRRLLEDRINQAILAAKRSKLCAAVFFIDLDNFKAVNDTYGHSAGDDLLIEVSNRIRSVIRGVDTVARQGGDEFIVLAETLGSNKEEAYTVAAHLGEKIVAAFVEPIKLNGGHYQHLSIGAALFCEHDDIDTILKHADEALYQAKHNGKNQICFYSEDTL